MSEIERVGRKMLEVARRGKFKWERAGAEMCYQTTVAGCTVEVSESMFRVRNGDGDELDTVITPFGGTAKTSWVKELWRQAHLSILAQENVFEEILAGIESLGQQE